MTIAVQKADDYHQRLLSLRYRRGYPEVYARALGYLSAVIP